jgi:hypothetical protein
MSGIPTDVSELERTAISIAADLDQTRRNVSALGAAIHAADVIASPPLARAVQAQQNLYDRIETEFGLLTSAQAADQMGSRAVARRNAATAARNEGKLLALRRSRYLFYPGFQFTSAGIRPVIANLWAIAREHGWGETSLLEWMVSPTTYLAGQRPVDVIDDPDRLLTVAREAFAISW